MEWKKLVDEEAKNETANLFPRKIKEKLIPYLLGVPKSKDLTEEQCKKIGNVPK